MLLAAYFPQMTFTRMQERLRRELLRRIEQRTLTISSLAQRSGLGQSHVSNFLRHKRNLSLQGMDRILDALKLKVEELLPPECGRPSARSEVKRIPLVSRRTALMAPVIRQSEMHAMLAVPKWMLERVQASACPRRLAWDRFVAIQAASEDVEAMAPDIPQNAPRQQNLWAISGSGRRPRV